MKPGREMDALVAEKVMGWRRDGLWLIHPDGDRRWEINTPEALQMILPKYSTDIAAAWEVMEKLNSGSKKWELNSLWCDPNDGKWSFGTFDRDGIWPNEKFDTVPHAICLAALKAVGVEVL